VTSPSRNLDIAFRPWRAPANGERPRSLWVDEALAKEANEPINVLRGKYDSDVCIIGGGFTGLWTAIRLRQLDPALRVTIVEADRCGTGASGRNSGGIGHWWGKLPTLLRLLGPQDAVRLVHESEQAMRDIRAFVTEHQISCDIRDTPSVWSATAPVQIGAWDIVFRAADKVGLTPPLRPLSQDELKRMFGKGPYLAGVIEDGIMRAQPALLARGLRRVVSNLGVAIFEESPVVSIAADGRRLAVLAEDGTVTAEKIVLAANAWMAHLPEFRPYVMVISSDVVITDPIPDILEKHGLRNRPGGHNSRQMLNYGGITPDGRVYLGRGGGTLAYDAHIGPEFDYSPKRAADAEDDFRFLYPELRDVPIARAWAGPVDRSTTGLPWFGRLVQDDRVHYAIGYTGHGVGASELGGRILASDVLDRRDEWSSLADCFLRARSGRFPPEPLRYVAGRVVRAAVDRKERADRDGRKPWAIDKSLAKLAPATISDFRKRL
jgi:glycine/D-amino acid oxidase-like deaminating enzyme